MAITYFGSASTPADNGTSTGTPIAVAPPASMVTGDLVILYGYYRGTSTISVSNTGGQTWSTAVASQTAGNSILSLFITWCRWNGTWSANPSLAFSTSTTNTNAVMHVFRPTSSSNLWDLDNTPSGIDTTAPSSPFACVCNFNSAVHDSTVAIGSYMSDDDNTWGTILSGWTGAGTAQYRNTSGTDSSSAYAYKILTAAGAPGTLNIRQATLGGDPYFSWGLVFYEYSPSIPNKAYNYSQAVKRASFY